MAVIIKNCHVIGAGRHGFNIDSRVDAKIIGSSATDVGGNGFNISGGEDVRERLGLPRESDPLLLAELLETLTRYPSNNHQIIVEESSFLKDLKNHTVDLTGIIANVLTIASYTALPAIINQLRS